MKPGLPLRRQDRINLPKKITKAAPAPQFGRLSQISADRVVMHVAQFLHVLAFAEDIEVIVLALPEAATRASGNRPLVSAKATAPAAAIKRLITVTGSGRLFINSVQRICR